MYSQSDIFQVGVPEFPTGLELLKILAHLSNWKGKIILANKEGLSPKLKEPYHWKQDLLLDSSKIRSQLDFKEVIGFEDGLQETITFEEKFHNENPDIFHLDYKLEDQLIKKIKK